MAKAKKRTKVEVAASPTRNDDLKKMLKDRQLELTTEVQGGLQGVRNDGAGKTRKGDAVDLSEANTQEHIKLALIQMKAETLSKINEALARLEAGRYGFCFECGEEISEARLRALPFAVRCKDCEEARENVANRKHALENRPGLGYLFHDPRG